MLSSFLTRGRSCAFAQWTTISRSLRASCTSGVISLRPHLACFLMRCDHLQGPSAAAWCRCLRRTQPLFLRFWQPLSGCDRCACRAARSHLLHFRLLRSRTWPAPVPHRVSGGVYAGTRTRAHEIHVLYPCIPWVESDFETSMYVHSVLSHDLP